MASDSLVTSIKTPQFFYEVHSNHRFEAICRVLDEYHGKSVIIFCRTKKDVDHIADKLQLLNYRVSGYHGDLTPSQRNRAFQLFTKQKVQALLVTDLPPSFDDLKHIDFVLFSAVPQDPDSYIQRILWLESELSINEVATLIHANEYKKIAFIKRVTKSEISERSFMPVEQIIDLKKEQLSQNLAEFSDNLDKSDPDIATFSDELLKKYSPEVIVNYLLYRGFFKDVVKDGYLSLDVSKKSKSEPSVDDSEGGDRLFIAIGKADGIDEARLIEFLAKETNIASELFTNIKLFDTFSFFVVPTSDAEIVLEIFRRKKRGKRSIVERAKGKDSNKKKS